MTAVESRAVRVRRPRSHGATSTKSIRRASATAVLEAVWAGEPVTGSDLIATTGLTRATVHDVCADLIASGWVEELADQRAHGSYERGRPARRYGLRSRAAVVVGVDAGTSRVTALVTDLRGQVLGRAEAPVVRTAEHRRAVVERVVGAALADAGASAADVLSCTAALPAPVAASGRVEVTSNAFWTVMDAGLTDHLHRLLGCEVAIANDADLAAVAEGRRGAATGTDDHISLLVDAGFGAGVVASGVLVRGRYGRGGEMRWLDLVSDVGAPLGLAPLLAHWAERGAGAPPPGAPAVDAEPGSGDAEADLAAARAVLRSAAAGAAAATAVIERAGHHLARIIATAGGLLDPEVVVLTGHLAPDLEPVVAVVERRLPELLDAPVPRVATSLLGPDAVATGAALHALDHVHEHALDLTLPGVGGARGEDPVSS